MRRSIVRELSPWAKRSTGRQQHREMYAAYITSAQWWQRRHRWVEEQRTRMPADHSITCLGCHRLWRLGRDDLHHITYERLGAEAHEDLWPMCRQCHTDVHDVLDSTKSWRRLPRAQANRLALSCVMDSNHPERRMRASSALSKFL